MTLIEKLQEWYDDGGTYPPTNSRDFKFVAEESIEEHRWGTRKMYVFFEHPDQYVAVEDVEPATEYQDWGDYGPPEIYEVEPYEVVVTRYRSKND